MQQKAIFILLFTLCLGFGLGFLTNGYLVRQDMNKVKKFATQNGFENMINDLHLADSQKQKIQPLIDSNYELIQWYNDMYRQDLQDMQDSLYTAISQVLSTEQQQKLAKEKATFEQRIQKSQQEKKTNNSTSATPTNKTNTAPSATAPSTASPSTNSTSPSNEKATSNTPATAPDASTSPPPLRPPPPHFPPPPHHRPPPFPPADSLAMLPKAERDSIIRLRYERLQRYMRRNDMDTSDLRPAQKRLYQWYEQYLSGDTLSSPPRLLHKHPPRPRF
jgi:chemotaxis protein histidine kinase CheA